MTLDTEVDNFYRKEIQFKRVTAMSDIILSEFEIS